MIVTSSSHQMSLQRHLVIYFILFVLLTLVSCDSVQSDFDDESMTGQTSSTSRAERRSSRSRVVTGTFRFRRVFGAGDVASRRPAASRGAGWDIEGCYCETGSHCSCSGNRNRVRMFVRTGSKRPPMPGMGFPMPPPGMFGGDEGGDDLGPVDGEGPVSPSGLETMDQETSGRLRRPRSGCFCTNNGCTGSDCATMNGCVCSQGACWGSACDSRIPTNPSAGQQTSMMTSGNLMATGSVTPQLTNPLQLVRNALFAANPVVSVNGQPTNNQQQNGQLQSANPAAVTIGDCSCSNQGCTGSGCANMNGCFCVGSNCWGNACNINSIIQASGNLLSNANSNALRVANQATNQAVLSNLAGRLAGQLNLPNGQTGQTSGNLLDIPGLTGAGGILNSLLPGGFGGGDAGALNPFGGGGGGGGAGGGGYPQGMQVVQGVPVKRLTASRARRIRGKGVRGRPGMELAATRGRVRPAHRVRKKIVPVESADESSETLSVLPHERMDPVLDLIELDRVNPVNSSLMLPQEHMMDQGYQESLNNGQESLDVFTLTDEWLSEMTQGQST